MIIHKFVVHVLDKNVDTPILNSYEGKISLDMDKFLQKNIKKLLKHDLLRKAKFKNYEENRVKLLTEQMIYDDKCFLENSKEIAAYLFDIMKKQPGMNSCDLIVCKLTQKDETYIAILKLDYKEIYNHSIDFKDDKFNIQILQNEAAIGKTATIKQGFIVGVNGLNDEYDLRVLDVEAEKEDLESSFLKDYLDIQKVIDDTYKTKMFETYTSSYITNVYSNNLKKQEDVRHIRDYMLLENSVMDIGKFLKQALDNEDEIKEFKTYLESQGVDKDFNINKKYVEKKLKNRNIKTDSGINLKLERAIVNDPMKFSMKQNPDGSYDIVIKGVKRFEEK
ncbi:nucleoid-associated protein [Romboutsia sp. 1001216sp1]|uniref:nucleoid-associated protein n=1 Tax=unclassified Romboutsia TaxID=2626894 RepID=UPI00189C8E96|nr:MULTISPECIES: nucleoid-associated protein [unclassified Romboutsia]MDB8790659.1 nucleoid-associated protein [Romboutsia sp. 1001216sp1]MDB8803278.1 nucleoid-associated protein [Romboutsia sp. 1001216sp1]MDB8814614.1 nucleoid-associated protein [Romboutsia sp. 1001216sp1]